MNNDDAIKKFSRILNQLERKGMAEEIYNRNRKEKKFDRERIREKLIINSDK